MTVWVAGTTHIVLLPKNGILRRECEENNSPTQRKWTFLLDWNFFWTTMTSWIESFNCCYTFDCRNTSKKNARCYSQGYLIKHFCNQIVHISYFSLTKLTVLYLPSRLFTITQSAYVLLFRLDFFHYYGHFNHSKSSFLNYLFGLGYHLNQLLSDIVVYLSMTHNASFNLPICFSQHI